MASGGSEQRVRRRADRWPYLLFGLHLLHGAGLATLYPHRVYDADVLSYLAYFRSWLAGSTALHGMAYFTVPKPLLVFGLGPFASVWVAFACSAVASAGLGALVYLIGRRVFDRTAGILLSLFLLLDVEKAVLTLTSSADLYVAVLLFAAIQCALAHRYPWASAALLLSALVKPVTLPCALYALALDGVDRRTRWLALLVPAAAIPLILLSNHLLLGEAMAPGRFFAGFDSLSEGAAIGPEEVLHFVAWSQLAKHAFIGTAPWGVLGLALWVSRDRQRLASPFLLVPLLFLGGYVLLAAAAPYVPFFRFFWPVQIWFGGFVIHGMLEAVRRTVRAPRILRLAVACGLVFFLADDALARLLAYRIRFALPFERGMAFVASARDTLVRERRADETILTPLAYFPYLVWELGAEARPDRLLVAERLAAEGRTPAPDWIVYVPDSAASRAAQERLHDLARGGGYAVRLAGDRAALLVRPTAAPLARIP